MGIYLSKPFYETSEEEESEFSFKKNLEIPDEELNNTKCSCNKNVNSDCNVRITQFTIERHIHDTDRCYVYEVKDRMTNQRFAMKCIITSNENKRKIASNEVKNLMSLQGNKHIVECMHVFHTTDYCLIVEELLEGYLVDYFTHTQTAEDLSFARVLGSELAEVLRFIHSKGLVYAGLKLNDIMFDSDGQLKLSDFDMTSAQDFPDKQGIRLDVHNTPLIMAPEQYKGKNTEKTDWFNYGMILSMVLTGESPNKKFFIKDDEGEDDVKETMKKISENEKDFVMERNGENEKAAELIDKCLKNKEKERIDLDNDKVFNEVSFLQNITEKERENFQKKILGFAKRVKAFLYLY